MPNTPDPTRLLTAGARYVDEDGVTYVVEPHALDDAILPTGQIVGCDPLVNADEAPPYTVSVPPGRYRLMAWVAVLHRDGALWQRRTAALQLVVCDEPATGWELALLPDQNPAELTDDEYFGYGVDAGTGTLADLVAVRALAGWEYERMDEVFIPAQLPAAPVPGAIGAITDEETGANVVTVSTGWGDGVYPTFVGRTGGGEVCSFVTDFMVIPAGRSPSS